MARTKAKSGDESTSRSSSQRSTVSCSRGLVAIVAGYVLLADGSTVGAPLLLVLGYAVLIPLAIIL